MFWIDFSRTGIGALVMLPQEKISTKTSSLTWSYRILLKSEMVIFAVSQKRSAVGLVREFTNTILKDD
jgi:hypothetical protein